MPPVEKIRIVCAKKESAKYVAGILLGAGFKDVGYLVGGIGTWADLLKPVIIEKNNRYDLYQFVRPGKASLSYGLVAVKNLFPATGAYPMRWKLRSLPIKTILQWLYLIIPELKMETEERLKSLDLTGFACPIPIVKISKAIKDVNQGEVIEALTSDSGAPTDFPAWARTSRNEILKSIKEGENTRFFIKRS